MAAHGGVLPLSILAELVNIGTLLAFVIVCIAVLVMRRTHPEFEAPVPDARRAAHPDPRNTPLPHADVFAAVGELAGGCVIWLGIGLVIYFCYGRRHSVMARLRRGGK